METIKTENKVESKSLNEEEIKEIYSESNRINQELRSSASDLVAFLEHLNENRDKEILWSLLWDVIERMDLAVMSSVNYFNLNCVDLSNAKITYN